MWLGVLLIFLCIIPLSIVFSTIQTGISPMPSRRLAREAVLRLVPENTEIIVDLGSGWGGMLMSLAKAFPNAKIIGYECSWLPFLWSRCFCRLSNIFIYRENFLRVLAPKSSVLICYLCPRSMENLSRFYKGRGNILISHTFALPNNTPIQTLRILDRYKSPIYVYLLTDKHSGKKNNSLSIYHHSN